MDGLNNQVEYTYTLLGQMKEVITPNSRKVGQVAQSFTYDARGNITGVVDGKGTETKYLLDDWGRITEIITPEGGREKYTYDSIGNITSTTDANGGTITYVYNSQNQVCEIKDQEGKREYFYYDEEGNQTHHVDRDGNQVRGTYNLDHNITFRQDCNSQNEGVITQQFTYYPDGTLAKARVGGMAYQYEYTLEGLLKRKSSSGRTLLSYSYDKNHNIKSMADITGKEVYYSYDKANRLAEVQDQKEKMLARYSYDASNQIQTIQYGNGLSTQYTYDGEGQVESLVTMTSNGEVLLNYNYAYDLNGNRLQKVGNQHQTYYEYDQMNRLKVTSYDGYSEHFTYDLVGNRIERTADGLTEHYLYNTKNQLLQIQKESGMTCFTYSMQGNTIKEETPEGTNYFEYNALNQPIKAVTKQGNTLISRYDAEGMRHEIEENEKIIKFIFHNKEVIVETDEQDKPLSRFTRGYGIIAANCIAGSSALDEYYYYVQDEQLSTAYIVDNNQAIQNEYIYDAFGNIINKTEKVHNRITYTGQQYDLVTQQYYLRARFYNPTIGRFTQEDVYRGDGLNLYSYCHQNPVIYFDPSGYKEVHSSNPEVESILKQVGNEIPTNQDGKFAKWFDKLTPNQVELLYSDKMVKKQLGSQSRLRNGGGKHEWLTVSRASTWKEWGISVEEFYRAATNTEDILFTKIKKANGVYGDGPHGIKSQGISDAAHKEVFDIIDSSKNFDDFKRNLNNWANEHLEVEVNGKRIKGAAGLPEDLQTNEIKNNKC